MGEIFIRVMIYFSGQSLMYNGLMAFNSQFVFIFNVEYNKYLCFLIFISRKRLFCFIWHSSFLNFQIPELPEKNIKMF